LLAGGLPLIAGLVMARVAPNCASAPLVSLCTAFSLGVGTPAGAWLGLRAARGTATAASWLVPAGISVLAASLGCVGLGVAGVFGAAIGLLFGAVSPQWWSRERGHDFRTAFTAPRPSNRRAPGSCPRAATSPSHQWCCGTNGHELKRAARSRQSVL